MATTITLDDFLEYGKAYPCCPITRSLPETVREPLDAFLAFKRTSRHCFILESLENAGERGRYTFIGFDPRLEISCKDGLLTMVGATTVSFKTDDPSAHFQTILDENRAPKIPSLPPFTGGLTGYFAYEYIRYAEPTLAFDSPDIEGFRDVDLMLFDKVAAYDHKTHEIVLIINARTADGQESYYRALSELDRIESVLRGGEQSIVEPLKITSDFVGHFDKERFTEMINKAKWHIHEGDIFQAVLSNAFEATAEGSLFDTYKTLRAINPSPYMFYFSSDKVEIAGASPETLVRLTDRTVTTYPLAGTRPRGESPEEDLRLERELLADPKELAEHNMLVDLGRNDIGKISEFGSVHVDEYMNIERFSHVMHIGSTVSGTIREDQNALSAIASVLPAGTLSGAPKIRAVEIIHALEGSRRGIYGGAIGYLGVNGDMDTCIAIRIAYKKNGKVFVRSGAGIVKDSVPESEFEECRNKARAVMKAVTGEK